MTTANKVLAKAKSQLGVMESPSGSNNVKYNTFYYGHKVYGAAYAWCAAFLYWCFKKSGSDLFPKNANAAYAQDEVVSKCGGKWIMKKTNSSATRKGYLKKAKPGDIVCFDFGKYNSYRQHIGIVKSVSGDYVWCYEGNTSVSGSQSNGGKVCLKKRHYSMICSAARPAYSEETKKVVKTTKKTTKKTNKAGKTSKKKIYVNAGHSNTDPGATSKYGTERKFNVAVRDAMVSYLKEHYNVQVKYNTGDFKDIKKITESANKWKADLYVSIHFNACGSHEADGFEALVYSEARNNLARTFIKHIKAVGQNSRGIRYRPDLVNLSHTDMPAILCECAYIDNWKDIKDWNDADELKKMGEALAKAAAEYLGL